MLPDLELLNLDLFGMSPQDFESRSNYPISSDMEWQAIGILQTQAHESNPQALPRLNTAIKKALEAHYGIVRETGEPYSMHLLVPAIWAQKMGFDMDVS